MNIVPQDALEFLWVVDFPMFELKMEEQSTYTIHFTMPNVEKLI